MFSVPWFMISVHIIVFNCIEKIVIQSVRAEYKIGMYSDVREYLATWDRM